MDSIQHEVVPGILGAGTDLCDHRQAGLAAGSAARICVSRLPPGRDCCVCDAHQRMDQPPVDVSRFTLAQHLEWLLSPGESEDVRMAAALVIAAASTLQAAAGGKVLHHEIGYPAPLDNIRDVTRFLLYRPFFV